MKNPLRARGMCDYAFEAYFLASHRASIDIDAREDKRVMQAIGDAVASHGYHHQDGVLDNSPYTAACDLSVHGLTRMQIASWLEELCIAGFVAFYRNWAGNTHIHANYCGVPQKRQLDGQNEDFFAGRDGLVGHRRIDDEWWFPERERRRVPEKMFRVSNGPHPQVVRSPIFMPASMPVPPSYAFYLNNEASPRFWMPVRDGVALAPVRAFGSALGFDVAYLPDKKQIEYDGEDVPVALTMIEGIAHSPVRQLVREVGLQMAVNPEMRRVTVSRALKKMA